MLVSANSGIDFSMPPEDRPTKREVIEILDDEDNDIVDQLINEESIQQQYEDKLPKIEEYELGKTYPRRQSRARMIIEDQNETEQQMDSIKTTICM